MKPKVTGTMKGKKVPVYNKKSNSYKQVNKILFKIDKYIYSYWDLMGRNTRK